MKHLICLSNAVSLTILDLPAFLASSLSAICFLICCADPTAFCITGSAIGASDKKLKKNINKIGISPSGINIYSFEYIDNKFGNGVWQGVLSNEVPSIAVVKHEDGYDMVNYSLIDVEFKQL